jgi:hypothetical protein
LAVKSWAKPVSASRLHKLERLQLNYNQKLLPWDQAAACSKRAASNALVGCHRRRMPLPRVCCQASHASLLAVIMGRQPLSFTALTVTTMPGTGARHTAALAAGWWQSCSRACVVRTQWRRLSLANSHCLCGRISLASCRASRGNKQEAARLTTWQTWQSAAKWAGPNARHQAVSGAGHTHPAMAALTQAAAALPAI